MPIIFVVGCAAICLGVLYGSSRVPTVRVGPLISLVVLTLVLGIYLVLNQMITWVDGVAFVALFVISSSMSVAVYYRRKHPELDEGVATLMIHDLVHPKQLRQDVRARNANGDIAYQ